MVLPHVKVLAALRCYLLTLFGVAHVIVNSPCYGVSCVMVFCVNLFLVLAHVIVLVRVMLLSALWCYRLTLLLLLAHVMVLARLIV